MRKPGSRVGTVLSAKDGTTNSLGWDTYRCGEEPFTFDTTWEAGDTATSYVWRYNADRDFDVMAITWEIFTSDEKDLAEMVWSGHLHWSFDKTGQIRIGPLSMFYGSFPDLVMGAQGKKAGDLERLGEVLDQQKWMEGMKAFVLGKGTIYRGMSRYTHHPVAFPKGSHGDLHLDFRYPFTCRELVRFRVNLHGRAKTVINVG